VTLARARWQLTAWYVGVLLAIVCLASGAAYVVLARSLNAEVDSSLRSSARNIALQIEERGVPTISPGNNISRRGQDDDDEEREDGEIEYFNAAGGDIFYILLSRNGEVLQNPLNVDSHEAVDQAAVQAALDKGEVWRTLDTEGGTRALFLAVGGDSDAVVVEVGRSLARHEEELADLLRVLLITGGAGLLLAAVGGFLLAGRALEPTRVAFERQRRFVSDASHELRAPLTLIRASAEAIEGGSAAKLDEADRRSLTTVLSETDRMRSLVSDLLTLARFEEPRAAPLPTNIDTADLLTRAADEARLLSQQKRLAIRTTVSPGLTVYCDRQGIEQVLRILVDNAVRYSPEAGEVTLGARHVDDWVEFWVQDSGPGIPEEHRQHIFERFYRADASRSRADGGTGLGLAIAREIVEAQGGKIEVAGNLGGVGTKIAFRIPRRTRSSALNDQTSSRPRFAGGDRS
jgi:signal transduction histidine kinase